MPELIKAEAPALILILVFSLRMVDSTYRRWARSILRAYGINYTSKDVNRLARLLAEQFYMVIKVSRNRYVLRPRIDVVVPAVLKYIEKISKYYGDDPILLAYSDKILNLLRTYLPYTPDEELREIQKMVIDAVKQRYSNKKRGLIP